MWKDTTVIVFTQGAWTPKLFHNQPLHPPIDLLIDSLGHIKPLVKPHYTNGAFPSMLPTLRSTERFNTTKHSGLSKG